MYQRSLDAMKIVGATGTVYSAKLWDKTKVSWTAYIPNKPDFTIKTKVQQSVVRDVEGSLEGLHWGPMTAQVVGGGVKSFTCKVNLEDTAYFKNGGMKSCTALLDGSTVMRTCVTLQDSHKIRASLPVAVDTGNATVQISRKKGYFNLIFSFYEGTTLPCISMSSTGIAGQFDFVGVSRTLLDSMPKIDVDAATDANQWFIRLARAQACLDESEEREAQIRAGGAALGMKETIRFIITHFADSGYKFFAFSTQANGVEAVLYVNSVRLNFEDGSIVLDTAVCMLTLDNRDLIDRWASDLIEINQMLPMNLSTKDMGLWKISFPCMSERTRNNWEHSDRCQYVRSTNIPGDISLSCAIGESAMCRCCLGKGLEHTEFERQVGSSHPVYHHFFRAAISPFFNIRSYKK